MRPNRHWSPAVQLLATLTLVTSLSIIFYCLWRLLHA